MHLRRFDIVVDHKVYWDFIFDPFLGSWAFLRNNVEDVADKVLVLLDGCVDMSPEFTGICRTAHCNSEPVVHIKVLHNEIYALKSAEHIVDRHQTCPVLVELSLNIHCKRKKDATLTINDFSLEQRTYKKCCLPRLLLLRVQSANFLRNVIDLN